MAEPVLPVRPVLLSDSSSSSSSSSGHHTRKERPAYDSVSYEEVQEEDGTRRQLLNSDSRKERFAYNDSLHNSDQMHELSERRRALFEPLGPTLWGPRDGSPQSTLPPPDFDFFSYPRGWVVGKRRKLVNVDVVESMRHIAVQEMNRKDREINGLNEQLEEDSRTMSYLQLQLQQERNKRIQAERENKMLQSQVGMLMSMLNDAEEAVNNEEI
ncbi:unnamed protein product [Sphagnum jensenii]|uniref:Protein HEADING DATE REPRESSOR 1-like n=1 Tax=Sphagnum jensenii TaxID=128206 RepID=A0ABP0WLK1_9BRYO